jgi:hypothetical protein
MNRHWRRQALREGRGRREALDRIADIEKSVADVKTKSQIMLWYQLPTLFLTIFLITILVLTFAAGIDEELSPESSHDTVEIGDYRRTI